MPEARPADSFPILSPKLRRGLWLALTLLVLVVQTGIAAHEETHPLGQSDSQCHYCALGGNLFGMPGQALPPPAPPMHAQVSLPELISIVSAPIPRGYLSRAPPSETPA
jgi:hypothetical protein